MDVNSLSHSKWNCKYHVVFAPKYRRKVAYGQLKEDIANVLSMLCKRKGVEDIMWIRWVRMQKRFKNIFEINYKKIWNMTK